MSENKQDKWTTWVALSTAVMAVLAAITTLYMGKFSSRTVLLQGQETDQWAYYQAKSIKQHTFELQRQRMELDFLVQRDRLPKPLAEKIRRALAGYEGSISRYNKEKEEIKAKAETLAKQKQTAQEKAGNFGYGLIFLQISIMLSSVSVITKKKPLWYLGLASVAGGVFYLLNGLYLFY